MGKCKGRRPANIIVRNLAPQLAKASAPRSTSLEASQAYLQKHRDVLRSFHSLEDLVVDCLERSDSQLKGICHHFTVLRNSLQVFLREKQVFVGNTLIEELLFGIASSGATQLLQETINFIRRTGIHQPGLLIYPLNSFGILGAAGHVLRGLPFPYFVVKSQGIGVLPQQHSFQKACETIMHCAKALNVRGELRSKDIEHYRLSRNLVWLERNPLLLVRIRQFQDHYYENQFFVIKKALFARCIMYMLYTMQEGQQKNQSEILWSTSAINNFETLDANHYLLFQTPLNHRKYFSLECVPMNVHHAELVEMSELNAEVDPRAWRRKRKGFNEISLAMEHFEAMYFSLSAATTTRESIWTRVLRRIEGSLRYFSRSFRESALPFDSDVYLAVAFEALLDDFYSRGVTERVKKRAYRLLKGVDGVRKYVSTIVEIFESRGAIVHHALSRREPDINIARQAYVLCFVRLVELLNQTDSLDEERPIGVLLTNP